MSRKRRRNSLDDTKTLFLKRPLGTPYNIQVSAHRSDWPGCQYSGFIYYPRTTEMRVGVLSLEILYQGGDVSTVWRMFRDGRLKWRQCRRFWGSHERGFGAAHIGVLSGVGAAAPRSLRGNRMGPLAAGDLTSRRGRRAVTSFCEQVMLLKEAAERARVRSSHPERIDRRGCGRRRGRAWTRRSRVAAPPGGG